LISRNASHCRKSSNAGSRRAGARQIERNFNLLFGRSIVVVAADHGLRRSVAFALEVEGYATLSYDTLRAAEDASRVAPCTILDDEIVRSESQAATRLLQYLGARAVLLVDGLSALQAHVGNTVLTKPFSGPDLLGVISNSIEAAK
jgi:DNA-binding response OmpR family regulator